MVTFFVSSKRSSLGKPHTSVYCLALSKVLFITNPSKTLNFKTRYSSRFTESIKSDMFMQIWQ